MKDIVEKLKALLDRILAPPPKPVPIRTRR